MGESPAQPRRTGPAVGLRAPGRPGVPPPQEPSHLSNAKLQKSLAPRSIDNGWSPPPPGPLPPGPQVLSLVKGRAGGGAPGRRLEGERHTHRGHLNQNCTLAQLCPSIKVLVCVCVCVCECKCLVA